jgi:hypothetical protein
MAKLVDQRVPSNVIDDFLKTNLDGYHCDILDLRKLSARSDIAVLEYRYTPRGILIEFDGRHGIPDGFRFLLDLTTARFEETTFHYEAPI